MCTARKGPLCNLRKMQAQISLRISAGWSGPSLSPYRITGYWSICQQSETAQIRLQRYTCCSVPTLSANCIRGFFVHCTSNIHQAYPKENFHSLWQFRFSSSLMMVFDEKQNCHSEWKFSFGYAWWIFRIKKLMMNSAKTRYFVKWRCNIRQKV